MDRLPSLLFQKPRIQPKDRVVEVITQNYTCMPVYFPGDMGSSPPVPAREIPVAVDKTKPEPKTQYYDGIVAMIQGLVSDIF